LAENVYEGMFILDSNRYGRDPEGVSGRISKLIEGAGGRLLVSRLWEERRLAYAINGHRKGTYWLSYFHLDGVKLAEMERNCLLDDAILRVLFLKVDPRIVDALLTHAQGSPATAPATASTKDTGKESAKDKDSDTTPVGAAAESGDPDAGGTPEATNEEG